MCGGFTGVIRAVLANVGAAAISQRGLLGQFLIERNFQCSFDKLRGFGSTAAHCRNQPCVADCFGNQGRVLTFLCLTACGSDRFASLSHEETIGEIVSVGQPATCGLVGGKPSFCQLHSGFEMATSFVEASCIQIELCESAMGFDESLCIRSHFTDFLPCQAGDRMLAAVHGAARHFLQGAKARARLKISGPNVERLPEETKRMPESALQAGLFGGPRAIGSRFGQPAVVEKTIQSVGRCAGREQDRHRKLDSKQSSLFQRLSDGGL